MVVVRVASYPKLRPTLGALAGFGWGESLSEEPGTAERFYSGGFAIGLWNGFRLCYQRFGEDVKHRIEFNF